MNTKEITKLIRAVQIDIRDEYRADEFDDEPGIQLTVGTGEFMEDWDFQTGNNSYFGGAYHYPYWGVVNVYRDSDCRELAKEIIGQLEEQIVEMRRQLSITDES